MKTLIFILVSCIIPILSYAQKDELAITRLKKLQKETETQEAIEIKGAFGYKFGEQYTTIKHNKPTVCQTKPRIKYRNFSDCHLALNEKNRIYAITCHLFAKTTEEAKKEYNILKENIGKKYKLKKEEIENTTIENCNPKCEYFYYRIDNRYIIITRDDSKVTIQYKATELMPKNIKDTNTQEINAL